METHKLEAAANKHIWKDVSDRILKEYMEQSFVADPIEYTIQYNSEKWDDPSIFQWWRVDNNFALAALNAGEVIVITPLGILWGRQTCGQPVCQDLNVQDTLTAMRSA